MSAPTSAPEDLDPGVIPSPLKDPHAWSSITVSGTTIGPADGSGKIVLKRAGRPYKWQVKDAKGQDGGVSTYQGKRPPEWEIEFHMWTDTQFHRWQSLSQTWFLYDAGKTSVDPVDVYHPGLAMVGISQILVDDLGVPEQQGDRKYWIASVKVHEYFPPVAKDVTTSPTTSAAAPPAAATPGTPPDPELDALQAKIAQELATQKDGAPTPAGAGLP